MSPRAPRERDFVRWIAARCPRVGDDLAVLPPMGGRLLAGIDPALDGVHFDLRVCGGWAAGRKAANRNLSDVAAMGGWPAALLVSLVVPADLAEAEVRATFEGVEAAAHDGGCEIIGGDYAVWSGPLAVTVAVLGEARRPVLRTGARPGQRLYVTGPLGGSSLGRHLSFTPRLEEGRALAAQASAIGLSAMMDVSDGLAMDLPRLLGKLGAELDGVPIHDDARRLDGDPLDHALSDGEDHELLFAADRPPRGVEAFDIGVVIEDGGVHIRRDGAWRDVVGGFEHGR